ncbi:histidine kinase, partial [Bacillus sp. B-TM1]
LFDEQAKLAHAREVGIEEGMEKGKKVGKEEGLQEGIEKGKIQLIRGMHKNGMDIEDISKFTNMDMSEVRHILEQ